MDLEEDQVRKEYEGKLHDEGEKRWNREATFNQVQEKWGRIKVDGKVHGNECY